MRPTPDTLKLPAGLVSELGITGIGAKKSGLSRGGSAVATRKDKRKALRNEKKAQRGGDNHAAKRQKIYHTSKSREQHKNTNEESPNGSAISKIDSDSEDSSSDPQSQLPDVTQKSSDLKKATPKSILKSTKKTDPNNPAGQGIRSPSPPPKRPSKAVQDKLADDDAEIAFLEKKLGIRSKKLPQSFTEDGLDDLLSGLDVLNGDSDEGEGKRVKQEEDEWLAQKRRKASSQREERIEEDPDSDGQDEDSASDEFGGDECDDDEEVTSEGEDFTGFDSDNDQTPQRQQRIRENPYVAPVAAGKPETVKYIPPSLRKSTSSDSEALTRLRRQTQGLVNRLTEANLISILGDIEKLYRENPRQHVTSTLVELLLTSVCEPTSLPDTLIILPAGFIAAVYKIIGTDFGAQVVQRVVELFTEHYSHATKVGNNGPDAAITASSKETSNLITLLSELYNFQVVGSNLMFDYIRLFLETLSELNAELLLKIIRTSGPQLRQDDPSSLKDIVTMLRPATAKIGEANMSVRTKFMIETINDLKNNKMKTGAAASAIVSEHTVRMRKTLGTLNTRNIKGSEPLRIGLKDIQESDQRGKWWLVGASWAGNDKSNDADISEPVKKASNKTAAGQKIAIDAGGIDLLAMARAHRMNTDIRRAIFITIMSSTDYSECHLRLLKLNLKKVQELEIPKVLIYCAGAEGSYNPYYTLIAKKLCEGDRRLKMAFQFGLWDLFGRMGENDDGDADEDDEGDKTMDIRQLVNFARLFGNLIASNSLSLQVLKKLNLSYLQEKTKMFLEVMLITVFLQIGKDKRALVDIVEKAGGTPTLAQGLLYFVRKVVRKTEVAGGKKETEVVKWACGVASEHLETMAVEGGSADTH